MCGRTRCTLRADDIHRACYLNGRAVRHVDMDRYRPSYNVAPGWNFPVVRLEDGSNSDDQGVALHCMKWGLIPSFTKKTEKPDHYKMFNARSESIGEKASFRRLVPKSRCLVSVEGFYEWKKDGSKKQPYYIHFKDGRPLVLAALFDTWKNPEGEIVYTFTILTTSSSSALEWLHDRMPVILGHKGSIDEWLNGSSSKSDALLKPYEEPDLAWHPVTPAMGKPSFDSPECIKEIQFKPAETKSIAKFFVKKEVNCEEKLKDPSKTDQLKCLKEGPETEDDKIGNDGANLDSDKCLKEEPSEPQDVKTDNYNPNADDSTLTGGGSTTAQIKRDFEEFSTDSKTSASVSDGQSKRPVRKKGNIRGAGDKQPTIFSYFGKG